MMLLVANPTSGGGRGGRLLPKAIRGLAERGIAHRVVVTEDGEHPERAAREAAGNGVEVVVAIGGDGLVGACANGLVGTSTALAVIPAGNGNDFARSLGLDLRRPLRTLDLLRDGTRLRVDTVRAEGPGWWRQYVCVGGAGFDSETNEFANTIRRLRGTARYLYAVIRTLVRFRPARFRLRVDDEERELEAMMVAVANAFSYGGGMRVAPEASLEDGIVDVCVVEGMSRRRFLAAFPRVFRGTHVRLPDITMLRGAKVHLDADRPFDVYADGERLGPLPATFTVEPGSLEVIAP